MSDEDVSPGLWRKTLEWFDDPSPRKLVPLGLYAEEIANILAAYDALGEKSPLYRFNAETRAVIDKLRRALEGASRP